MRDDEAGRLPWNADLSAAAVAACAERVRAACGIELLSVVITGDALTDGYLLSEAISARGADAFDTDTRAVDAWAGAVTALRSV